MESRSIIRFNLLTLVMGVYGLAALAPMMIHEAGAVFELESAHAANDGLDRLALGALAYFMLVVGGCDPDKGTFKPFGVTASALTECLFRFLIPVHLLLTGLSHILR